MKGTAIFIDNDEHDDYWHCITFKGGEHISTRFPPTPEPPTPDQVIAFLRRNYHFLLANAEREKDVQGLVALDGWRFIEELG
jgi:hypothetical protein